MTKETLGSESTITLFVKKSNLCHGQNAFLSHYNHSRLKVCQEVGGTSLLAAHILILSELIPVSSQTHSKVRSRGRTGQGVEDSVEEP